ncbi:MAG: Flp family type IVb pilin [Vicinamibacterales bacterium]
MKNLLKRLLSEDRGQDVIEYALLAAGISIVVIPIAPDIGAQLVIAYNSILGAVTDINAAP